MYNPGQVKSGSGGGSGSKMHVHVDNGRHGPGFTVDQRRRILLAYAAYECGIRSFMHPAFMQRMASCWARPTRFVRAP